MKPYDLVVKNGTLVDPEKGTISSGNVGIVGNKIVKVTTDEIDGESEIDAGSRVVCPGFIDVHSHLDGCIETGELSALQGITTSIGGNCGISPVNMKDFLDSQDEKGFIINQAELIGAVSLREAVGITDPYTAANKEQIDKMSEFLAKAFEEGAMGLSLGIEYCPGCSFEEMLTLSQLASKYDRIIAIHTNVGGPNNLSSLIQVIDLAKATGAHFLVSHFVYQYGTGIMTEALELVDKARNEGIKISVDSGMYKDFTTFIGSTIYDEAYMKLFGWKYENLIAASGKYKGRRLTTEMYKELRTYYPGQAVICYTGVEEEIYEALNKSYVMPSTDTGKDPKSHPQNVGTFPRFFRKMVRERKELSLLEAVKRCTLLPAGVFNLKYKGRLSEGSDADIVVMDINKITDRAEFPDIGEPDAVPFGIDYVIVNGGIVNKEGKLMANVLPGKTLRP
jgi:N-acyl-D-amino-acid deacylase